MKSTTLTLALGAMLAAGLCCVVPRVASDAYAQTKPGTDTKPGTEAKPVEEKFHSPFGGTKDASSAEALDFQNLMSLYGEMMGWESHAKRAAACKDKDDLEKMTVAYAKAKRAFEEALRKYILDWSPRAYQTEGKANDAAQREMDRNFHQDQDIVIGEIAKRRSDKAAPAACPKKKHKVYTEDDPRYMEDYQPPPHAPTHAPSHHAEPYPYPYPYPPPQSGDDQPSHPPTPDIPNAPYGTPSPP
jgi:hypothetical protein